MPSTTARCVTALRIAMMFNILCLMEVAPYKFGFRTATQHRQEEKQPDGTIMGEYGYVTANGFYLTTVYATDSKGRFRVLERRKEKLGKPAIKRQPKALNLDVPKTEDYFFNYTSTNEVQTPRNQRHHHEERGYKDGAKAGSYWWDSSDGFRHQVTYSASKRTGFKPVHEKIRIRP